MNQHLKIAGEQLRLARLAHGYSLEQVGELIGATRQFIHQLETDAKSPSDDTVAALSDVLGVSADFLRRPFRSTVRPEQCHFRSLTNRPAAVTSQILARGTILDRFVDAIESRLELPPVSFPDIPIRTAQDIEKAAESARLHWGLGLNGPITSMMRVAENAGAVVTYFGDLSERVDAFSMDRKRPIIVRSSSKESLFRQRFDLAHECGHLVMHQGMQTGDRDTETQAHRFAGAFLFPREAVLREFPRASRIDWNRLLQLKRRWRISLGAMIRRAYDLRMLTAVQYRTANIHLAKSGQKKVEVLDQDAEFQVEQPELLASMISALNCYCDGGALSVASEIGLRAEMLEVVTNLSFNSPDDDGNIVRLFK